LKILNLIEYKLVGHLLLDSMINFYGITDVILSRTPYDLSANFRNYRLLKIILILRILRVLKYLEFLKFIVIVIRTTFSSFIYIAISLLLLISAFAMMGMQIFRNKFDTSSDDLLYEKSFDYFSTAFMSVFQIISLDDWHLLYKLSYNRVNHVTVFFFLFFLIIIGNFILLNLFIANMLDGFEFVSEMDSTTLNNLYGDDEQQMKRNASVNVEDVEKKYTSALSSFDMTKSIINKSESKKNIKTNPYKKNIEDLTSSSSEGASDGDNGSVSSHGRRSSSFRKGRFFSTDVSSPSNQKQNIRNPSRIESLTRRFFGSLAAFPADEGDKIDQRKINLFKDVDEEFSLFFFSKSSKFRIFCKTLSDSDVFRRFLNFFIWVSSVKLALDTFIDWESDKGNYPLMREISYILNIIINIIFMIETLLKIISFGFFLGENSYLRGWLNIVEFSCIVAFMVDLFTIQEQFNIVKVSSFL
jgi:hypothetical protein